MKKTAKFLLTTLIAVAAILPVSATVYHETTQKVTQFDYSGYTYTYIDANGVEQTASIMDEATSPEQIKALVKLIYTNDTIPGIHMPMTSISPMESQSSGARLTTTPTLVRVSKLPAEK